jgi:hypothetical protein
MPLLGTFLDEGEVCPLTLDASLQALSLGTPVIGIIFFKFRKCT